MKKFGAKRSHSSARFRFPVLNALPLYLVALAISGGEAPPVIHKPAGAFAEAVAGKREGRKTVAGATKPSTPRRTNAITVA
jgi:hypothetical protein